MESPGKILIITNSFFPDRMVGGVRMTQWCRHLPEFGWKPTVLTRYFGDDATREELARHVHPEVDVLSFRRARRFVAGESPLENPTSNDNRATAVAPMQTMRKMPLKVRFARSITPIMVPDATIRFWRGPGTRWRSISSTNYGPMLC